MKVLLKILFVILLTFLTANGWVFFIGLAIVFSNSESKQENQV